MPKINHEKQEFIKLSWFLLECKATYYITDDKWCNELLVSDEIYDSCEKRYIHLCEKYSYENTVQNMVGFDMNRPSCQLALKKCIHMNKILQAGQKINNVFRESLGLPCQTSGLPQIATLDI